MVGDISKRMQRKGKREGFNDSVVQSSDYFDSLLFECLQGSH